MTQSKIAPRRWPFEIGTKMAFVQATPPVDWVQEVVGDKFLRVMTSNGGNQGLTTGAQVSTVNPSHTHTIPNHNHAIGSHYHSATHRHTLPVRTDGMVDVAISAIETPFFFGYEVKNGSPSEWSTSYHLRVPGSSANEGHHDHFIAGSRNGSFTSTYSGNVDASSDSTPTDGADTTDGTSPSLSHFHSVPSDFRPRYKDVIIARSIR